MSFLLSKETLFPEDGLNFSSLLQVDDAVRAAAFELLGELAKTVPLRFSKFFAKKVGGALAALMLHFHDPCPHVAQVCLGTIQPFLCAGHSVPPQQGFY